MPAVGRHPRRHRLPGDAAEHGRVGDAVAAEAVGAVHAAGILAGHEQARQLGRGIDAAHHAAHEVVRRRHHLHEAARKVEAAVGAALHHALEHLGDLLGPQVRHLDVERRHAWWCGPRASPRRWRARRCRAWPAPAWGRSRAMKRSLGAVEQMPARAAQAFLQHRAGHARIGAGQQPRRMELHHLHVAQRQAGAAAPWRGRPCSCRPTACDSGTWSARRPSPAARRRACTKRNSPVRMSIISTPARTCRPWPGSAPPRDAPPAA